MPDLRDRAVRAVGRGGGIAAATRATLANGFLTGVSLPVNGGEYLV